MTGSADFTPADQEWLNTRWLSVAPEHRPLCLAAARRERVPVRCPACGADPGLPHTRYCRIGMALALAEQPRSEEDFLEFGVPGGRYAAEDHEG